MVTISQMTKKSGLRNTPALTKAKRIFGEPLERTLKDKLNSGESTVSSIAKEVGVQKATVNYWLARLGIIYGRVAFSWDEVVRILSTDEARLIDEIIEKGVTTETIRNSDPRAASIVRKLVEFGISYEDLEACTFEQAGIVMQFFHMDLTEEEAESIDEDAIRLMIDIHQQGKTTDQVRNRLYAVDELNDKGIWTNDISGLDAEWISLINAAQSQGVSPAKVRGMIELLAQ